MKIYGQSSRRTRRILGVTLVSLLSFAAACGGGSSSDETSAPSETEAPGSDSSAPSSEAPTDETPVAGGTLKVGLEADVDGLDPTASSLAVAGLTMATAVFDPLFTLNQDGDVVPYLAESIEPSADFMVWTMTLRAGVVFHDGTPLTTDAVIKQFEITRADPLVGLAVRPYYPETGAVEKIDDLTMIFKPLEANQFFPSALTAQLGYVASPTWLDALAADGTLAQQPVGTGPFKFDSRSEDSVTKFVRNDTWWGIEAIGPVYLDAIEFYPVPDPSTRTELLQNGDLDILHTTDTEQFEIFRDDSSLTLNINEDGEEYFLMINTAKAPFDDIRVRQALALATDRQGYYDLFNAGEGSMADQMFTPSSPNYNPDVKQDGNDPAAAAVLVAEYCGENPTAEDGTALCSNGKVNMEYQWSGPSVVATRIADFYNEGWNESFNVTFDELSQADHIQEAALGIYNVVGWRQFGAENPGDDRVWLECRNIGGISLNWPRYCDEDRDALLKEIANPATPEARTTSLQQLVQNMHDAYSYIFMTHSSWAIVESERVNGNCDRIAPNGDPLVCSTNGRMYFTSTWLS
ncbi:MAG: ABC transporter substrate-binding protein [Ilumatobacteraceae bacterium]|nr:ABC transporter substrate-binding protein [Ilumatobacteraceae bacterium]